MGHFLGLFLKKNIFWSFPLLLLGFKLLGEEKILVDPHDNPLDSLLHLHSILQTLIPECLFRVHKKHFSCLGVCLGFFF